MRHVCSSCANSLNYCRCYQSALTFGWPMRPEWEEARRIQQEAENARKLKMWEAKAAAVLTQRDYNIKLYCACLNMADSYRKEVR